MFSKHLRVVALVTLAAAVLAACGGKATGTAGNPRTIEIQALDNNRFEPSEVTVRTGETIGFVVSNPGHVMHEFVLGPEHVQTAHEEATEMGEEHGEMDVEGQLAALELQPGKTNEVTVTFKEAEEIIYGCHEPGHYKAGMVGKVVLEA